MRASEFRVWGCRSHGRAWHRFAGAAFGRRSQRPGGDTGGSWAQRRQGPTPHPEARAWQHSLRSCVPRNEASFFISHCSESAAVSDRISRVGKGGLRAGIFVRGPCACAHARTAE